MSPTSLLSANLDSLEVWRHVARGLSEGKGKKEELEQVRGKRQVVPGRLWYWRGYSHP